MTLNTVNDVDNLRYVKLISMSNKLEKNPSGCILFMLDE
jgi:hypothetical protein